MQWTNFMFEIVFEFLTVIYWRLTKAIRSTVNVIYFLSVKDALARSSSLYILLRLLYVTYTIVCLWLCLLVGVDDIKKQAHACMRIFQHVKVLECFIHDENLKNQAKFFHLIDLYQRPTRTFVVAYNWRLYYHLIS